MNFSSSRSFGPGHAHELDAHAHEADIVDVRRHVRAGPGKANPGAITAGLGEDSAPHVLRQVVTDGELGPHDPVRLGVPAPLDVAGVPEPLHLGGEGRDDVVEVRLLVGLRLFLGELEALVLPALVHDRRDQPGKPIPEELVEQRAEEGIEAALQVDQEEQQAGNPVQQEVARIGGRQPEARAAVRTRPHLRSDRIGQRSIRHLAVLDTRRAVGSIGEAAGGSSRF